MRYEGKQLFFELFIIIKKFMMNHLLVTFGVDNIFDYTQRIIYTDAEDESAAYIYAPLTGRYISVKAGFRY